MPEKPERITKEAVLNFVKYNGPCLPNDVRKKLGSDTFFIGAFLSELIGDGKVFVSSLRVGGSPLYYCQGQEAKLQNFVQYLNEKDRQAYDLLKDRRTLRDSILTPLLRVSLRTIKDFARPVEAPGTKDLFWRWYLTPVELANEEVKRILRGGDLEIKKKGQETQKEQAKADVKPAAQAKQASQPSQPAPQPVQKTLAELKAGQESVQKPEPKKKEEPKQAVTAEKPREKPEALPRRKIETSDFLARIAAYFSESKIEVIETTVIKKASEADYVLTVPSAVGALTYYCKAKGKKTVNEGDLSSAYVTGESKKLPVLYVTTGKLTKRAKEMLGKEFRNMTVKELQ